MQPNVGRKWVNTWTPLVLTFFIFILTANAAGLLPLFDVVALDSLDRYDEFKARGTEETIDRTFLSADMLSGMIRSLDALHQAGVADSALSFDRVGELLFRISLRDTASAFQRLAPLPRSAHPASNRASEPPPAPTV